MWSYISTPPMHLHGVVFSSKKHRHNFTFTFRLNWKEYKGFMGMKIQVTVFWIVTPVMIPEDCDLNTEDML